MVTMPVSPVRGLGQEHIKCHCQVDCTRVCYLCGVGNTASVWEWAGNTTQQLDSATGAAGWCLCWRLCTAQAHSALWDHLRCFEATDFPLLAGIPSGHGRKNASCQAGHLLHGGWGSQMLTVRGTEAEEPDFIAVREAWVVPEV